jgi:membrane-bound serine protease (ClpP class)
MSPMRRSLVLTSAFVLAAAAAFIAAAPAGAATTTVRIVKVSGALDRPNVAYLLGTLEAAEDAGDIVVLQLDTAGALDEDAVALAGRVFAARVPVIAWVGPAPAEASGAGLLLLYASSLAAVAPGSQIGPLHPLDLAHPQSVPPHLGGTIAGWIDGRGKGTDTTWTDRPLTAAEARHRDIAQVTAQSVPALLTAIDGRTAPTAEGSVTLRTALATSPADPDRVVWQFHDLGVVPRVLHAMISPSAIYLLLVLGLAAVAFELTQPGFGFAGFSGVGMIALASYGLWMVPFSWLGLGSLLLGVGLLAGDVWIRRLGPLTLAGIVAFVAGSVLIFRGVSSAIDLSPALVAFLTAASGLYYGFGLTVAVQARDRIASTQRGLIGLVGEARGDLAPEGPVFVKGAMWRGRAAAGAIPSGAPVRVRGVDGLILRVELEPRAGARGDGAGAAATPT